MEINLFVVFGRNILTMAYFCN